ncbi:MAG TPA: hypothetical protein VFC46_10185 [Humisphaera sp.]|nr:hypothetical protein [Humisphaera sp.]
MTTTTAGPVPTISDEQAAFDSQARRDLENALTDISGLAHVLMALSRAADEVGETELSYLGGQLIDHERAALDAFCRIFKIDDYSKLAARPLAPGGSQDGDAELTRAEGDAA